VNDTGKETARRYLLAILAHVALIVAWYLFVTLGNVPKFVMPSPGETLGALLQPNYDWWRNIAVLLGHIDWAYEGALVVGVVPGTGAASALTPGEVIVAAEGQPITQAEQLVAMIKTKAVGDNLHLTVKKADDDKAAPREVDVKLSKRDDGSPLLGITQQTWKQEFHFPFAVDIDSGQIGGPSAGLAFTLAVLDVLTPGELTGGQRIAATGTIDPDGKVGPVGGVAQKTVAVKRAGATVFLVPSEEYAQAKARAGKGLRVEKVDSLDQALKVLATLRGSNALALGAPGARPQ